MFKFSRLFPARREKARREKSKTSTTTYSSLEERQLLAVTAAFAGGSLDIALTEAADTAVVSTNGADQVLVNGELVDSDPATGGVQPVATANVTDISITGNKGLTDLDVQLAGIFNSGDLNSVSLNNINEVALTGIYITDSFTGNFNGSGGSLTGAGSFRAVDFTINSATDFAVSLLNENNDFDNVSITTNADVEITDANDIVLLDTAVADLVINAEGSITDAPGTFITADRVTLFGSEIDLGSDNEVDFVGLESNTPGSLTLRELNSLTWVGFSPIGSADVQVNGTLDQASQSNVLIEGDADLSGNIVRLGVGGANEFNTGRLNVNSNIRTFVWENSGIELFGLNTTDSLDLLATGDITNSDGAIISVDGITSVQSTTSVELGKAEGDTFNTNSFEFFAPIVDIEEDSNTSITGLANFAGTLTIDSNGSITNGDRAFIFVQELANFISSLNDGADNASVEIGTSRGDFFSAAAVSFEVDNGNFTLSEDDATVLANRPGSEVTFANAISVTSTGVIINGAQAVVTVDTNASFTGQSIDLGLNSTEDNLQFGSLTLNSVAGATVSQNSDVLLTGDSNIGGSLVLLSGQGQVGEGVILDSATSSLTVGSRANFFASENITIGDNAGDLFEADTLTFDSAGIVNITQNGNIALGSDNDHSGGDVTLTALATGTDAGTIVNQEGSTLVTTGTLSLSAASDINIGNAVGDFLVFDNLNFNTSGNVDLVTDFQSPESGFTIFGSNSANELRLTTNVDVEDGNAATLVVDSFIQVTARNIVLGDTDDDCVDLPSAEFQDFTTTSGVMADITVNAEC